MKLSRPGWGLSVGLIALFMVACAGSPQPAVPSPAEPVSEASAEGTALSTIRPGTLSKAQEERRGIETALVFGSPQSFVKAFELISGATTLSVEEAHLYAWIGAKTAGLIYADASSSFVPADLLGQTEIPSSPLARLVTESLAGQSADVPSELSQQILAEFIPVLAIFRSDSRETSRRAFAALDRFELLGAPSLIPALARGLDAERRLAWTEALDAYAPARGLASDAWTAFLGSARAQLALGRPEEALSLLTPLPSEILAQAPYRKPLAQALYETGAFAKAEPLVAEALRDDPLDSGLALMRAHLLVRAHSYQQALPLLDAYGTVDPSNPLFLLLRARAAEGLRSRDEALRWARRGLGIYPDDPELLVITARLLFSAPVSVAGGQAAAKEEARQLAKEAFTLTAAPAEGLPKVLAASRAEAGSEAARLLLEDAVARYDWSAASTYLPRATTATDFNNKILVAQVLRKSGDWSAALEQATAWYQEQPSSEAAAEAYLRALVGTKNERAAQELIPRFLAGPGSPSFRSSLYYVQSLLQKSEEAVLSSLRSALVENADNTEALAAMYDLYFRRKDLQKARFYLKQALALAPGDPEFQRRNRELEASVP